MNNKICLHCGLVIQPGEARYTAGEYKGLYRHYSCHRAIAERNLKELESAGPVGKELAALLRRIKL